MANFSERSITEFRSRMTGGGARSNLFEVEIAFPEELGINLTDISDKVPFLVKAAEIPASNLGNIPVPYRGRVLPVAGDRTFCLLYTSPSPRDRSSSRMPSSA